MDDISVGIPEKKKEKKKQRKSTCCKHSLKCKHISKWKHRSSECGNCTSIPVLETEPLPLKHDGPLQRTGRGEMLRKLTKADILRKFTKAEVPKKRSRAQTLKAQLLPKFALFPAVKPCGCNKDGTNINEISDYNTRSLCKLPSDESYMSCRNCSPDSSETSAGITSEDSESKFCNIAVEVGNNTELMQDIGYNGSIVGSKHELSGRMEDIVFNSSIFGSKIDLPNPGDRRVERVDSPDPSNESRELKSERCEN